MLNRQDKDTPSLITVKLKKTRDKEKILKAYRKPYTGVRITLASNFLKATLEAIEQLKNILKVLKKKNFETRILISSQFSTKT